MTEEREALCRQLRSADQSLFYIAVLLVSIALSWEATARQRRGLCGILEGDGAELPDVFPLRLGASLLVIAALAFFFVLSVENGQESRGRTERERRSGEVNVWASLLVLAAALLRLYDLTWLQQRA